jgi:hypothetical protein
VADGAHERDCDYDVDLPSRRLGRCRMSEPVAVALGTRLDQVAATLTTYEARSGSAATESQLAVDHRRAGRARVSDIARRAWRSRPPRRERRYGGHHHGRAVTITAAAASATIRATASARPSRAPRSRASAGGAQ